MSGARPRVDWSHLGEAWPVRGWPLNGLRGGYEYLGTEVADRRAGSWQLGCLHPQHVLLERALRCLPRALSGREGIGRSGRLPCTTGNNFMKLRFPLHSLLRHPVHLQPPPNPWLLVPPFHSNVGHRQTPNVNDKLIPRLTLRRSPQPIDRTTHSSVSHSRYPNP